MNMMFPGPYIIYVIGFGLLFLPFLIPIDILIAGVLSGVLTKNIEEDNLKTIVSVGLFSIALNYVFIGAILGVIGIILFLVKTREYLSDRESVKYSIFGLICSIISILMTGIPILFFSSFIV